MLLNANEVLKSSIQTLRETKINYSKKIDDLAAQTGLDMEQLKKDRIDPQLNALVSRDISEGTAIGVRGTPTIFINGRLLPERSMAGFSRLIEDELRQVTPPQADPQ